MPPHAPPPKPIFHGFMPPHGPPPKPIFHGFMPHLPRSTAIFFAK
jgi:hypothetical protein